MKIPEGFNLMSIKLPTGGGLSVKYQESTKDKSITNKDSIEIESPADAHSDLTDKIAELDDYVADIYQMKTLQKTLKLKTEFTAKEETAADSLNRVIDNVNDYVMSKIDVTEFKISGEGAARSVVLSAKLEIGNKSSLSLKTPSIRLTGNKFGWEEDLDARIDAITEEILLYLFDGKRAEADLFTETSGKIQSEESKDKEVSEEKIPEEEIPVEA